MNKMRIYSIKDEKANVFGQLISCIADIEAVRIFHRMISEEIGGVYHKYPDDFCLVRVGEYDSVSGVTTGLENPEVVCYACDVPGIIGPV